ncbi:MAG: helix-turn-helix domain-containing protein [Bdellovibrionaceae bacterium]|nr:helix-turn-helix domain-containing protein [Pseudobdellovibrionaceae bacterium]
MEISKYNYYELLELEAGAPQHEITAAYERARRTYSGENPAIYTMFTESEARELLNMIEEAYAVLGNKNLRMIYDQRLLSGRAHAVDLSYESILLASKMALPEDKPAETSVSYQRDPAFEEQLSRTSDWNGALLKKVREYKNVSIDKLSEKTKINSWYLNAIEADDPSNLPAPVFVRGYVVQIAKELGLNEKAVADGYMKNFRNISAKPSHKK